MLILSKQGENNCEIARRFGVSEGSVRYHRRREAEGRSDGRKNKPMRAEPFREWIEAYWERHSDPRERNLRALYDELVEEQGYDGSYRGLVRYVRKHFPLPKIRPYRRLESPPGAEAQTDWLEAKVWLDDEHAMVKMYGLIIKLSHSRARAVVWRRGMKLEDWLTAHNQCWLRLGGVPALEHVDNVKTATRWGSGPQAKIHRVYGTYCRELGYLVSFCRPRTPTDKGKVERDVRSVRQWLRLGSKQFLDLNHLQTYTDRQIEGAMRRLRNPVTGKTVWESWQAEKGLLRPLPQPLPEAFDLVVSRKVGIDCMVSFEGRQYSVPFALVSRMVEVRGGFDGRVRIIADGQIVADHPRNTSSLLVLDPKHFEGTDTPTVQAPTPLGRNRRCIQALVDEGVEQRAVDFYRALVEVQ